MNNKIVYTAGSLACLVSLFLRRRMDKEGLPPLSSEALWAVDLVRLLICGIALYYVYRRLMRRPGISFLGLLMLAVGLLFNPIYVPPLSTPVWVTVEMVSMVLFYICALREKRPESGIRKEPPSDEAPEE